MCVEWSPTDTKAQLIEAARELGLDVSMSMLKADIVAILESASISKEEKPKQRSERYHPRQRESAVKDEVRPRDLGFDSVADTLRSDVTTKVDPVEASTFGVLDYLVAAGELVRYEDLIKDCGPEAKEEVNALLAAGKVVQHKRRNKFWFEAI